jgi:hypothetical protein
LNAGRPLGVPHRDKPLVRAGRKHHGEQPDMRGTRSLCPNQGHGSRRDRHRGAVFNDRVELPRAQDRGFRERDDLCVPSMAS